MGLRGQVLTSKERIHDLNVALEQAQRDLAANQGGFNVALAAIGSSNGINNPQPSADYAAITGA